MYPQLAKFAMFVRIFSQYNTILAKIQKSPIVVKCYNSYCNDKCHSIFINIPPISIPPAFMTNCSKI